MQLTCLLFVLGTSPKSSCAALAASKNLGFLPVRKTSCWKFLDVKLARFTMRIASPIENNRSTAAELGKRVLYFTNTSTQICRYFEL